MTIKLIPGLQLARQREQLLRETIARRTVSKKLAIVQVGDDPSSSLYVELKARKAAQLGLLAEVVRFSAADVAQVAGKIAALGASDDVAGIMIQAPIPGITLADSLQIFNAIPASKDVDGLTAYSLGRVWQLKSFADLTTADFFLSATPLAALDCLLWVAVQQGLVPEAQLHDLSLARFSNLGSLLRGKKALIINRSNIVGKPLAALLELGDATVTLAHSHTPELAHTLNDYDFILSATGQPWVWQAGQFRTGQVVIDIGIDKKNSDKVRGDVDISNVSNAADHNFVDVWIAGVPGGVGPLTVLNLLQNSASLI